MQVILKATYAGPRGTAGPGSKMELPDDEAKALIDGGYAEEVKPAPKPKAAEVKSEPGRETASVEQSETAAAPPPRRRRKTSKSEDAK